MSTEITNSPDAYKENKTKSIIFMVTPTERALILDTISRAKELNRSESMSSWCADKVLKACQPVPPAPLP